MIKNIIIIFFELLIVSVFTVDRINSFLSVNFRTNNLQWLFFLTGLIIIGFYIILLGTSLRIRILAAIKGYSTPFKRSISENLQVLGLYCVIITPLIIGVMFFLYSYNWQYKINRFDDYTVGVLIADFREISLEKYIPQAKYSVLLKERLKEAKFECKPLIPIKYYKTSAFFTSIDEAKRYGKQINATIVIWGEILRTEGILANRVRMNLPWNINWTIGNVPLKPIFSEGDYTETWSLQGLPIDIDTVLIQLEDLVVLPMIAKGDQLAISEDSLIEYLRCNLEQGSNLPSAINGIITFRIGQYYTEKGQYRIGIEAFHETYENILMDEQITYRKKEIFSSIFSNLAYCYRKLGVQDSTFFYQEKAKNINQ